MWGQSRLEEVLWVCTHSKAHCKTACRKLTWADCTLLHGIEVHTCTCRLMVTFPAITDTFVVAFSEGMEKSSTTVRTCSVYTTQLRRLRGYVHRGIHGGRVWEGGSAWKIRYMYCIHMHVLRQLLDSELSSA